MQNNLLKTTMKLTNDDLNVFGPYLEVQNTFPENENSQDENSVGSECSDDEEDEYPDVFSQAENYELPVSQSSWLGYFHDILFGNNNDLIREEAHLSYITLAGKQSFIDEMNNIEALEAI